MTTNTYKRYTQPVVQTQSGPTFKIAEVPLFEDPKGKWVKWEDYERLRAALTISRGQWIHSVNAEQCMIALGLEEEWREIEARRADREHYRSSRT